MLHTKLQVFALIHSGHNFWVDAREWQLHTVLNTEMLAASEIFHQSPCFLTSFASLSSFTIYFHMSLQPHFKTKLTERKISSISEKASFP